MSAKKFKNNPKLEDFNELILTKNKIAEWCGLDRHRFRYYLQTEQLSEKERKRIYTAVLSYCDELEAFAGELLE